MDRHGKTTEDVQLLTSCMQYSLAAGRTQGNVSHDQNSIAKCKESFFTKSEKNSDKLRTLKKTIVFLSKNDKSNERNIWRIYKTTS